ncbi:MAG: PaaI family thioesterase [Pseudohongiellaceae bacterium]
MNQSEFDIPDHYRHWEGDTAEDYLGPFFFYMKAETACTAFRVDARHCNAHQSLHGGILMAFADYTLCIAANGGQHDSVVTVTCNNEFMAPAYANDLVTGRGEVIKRGGSLIFTRCQLKARDQVILTASGVIKRLRGQTPSVTD